jgi:hypothetical protein
MAACGLPEPVARFENDPQLDQGVGDVGMASPLDRRVPGERLAARPLGLRESSGGA